MRSQGDRMGGLDRRCEVAHTMTHQSRQEVSPMMQHSREACHILFDMPCCKISTEMKPLFRGPRLFFTGKGR
jgi:hypothetical protein